MKIYHITTDGKAASTGKVMRAMVEKYYLDMVPYASLSVIQVFNIIKNLPYRPDPPNVETLMRPSYTMSMRGYGGDCLSEDTRLLTDIGYKKISEVRVGNVIMGMKGWTRIVRVIDKGIRQAGKYTLSNGGNFIATDEHRCIKSDGTEVLAGNLVVGDSLFQCVYIPQCGSIKLTNDDCRFIGYYLSDGWVDNCRVCISGKDGFPKEEQKRWVQKYAEGKKWKTSWHSRYIRVYIPADDYVRSFIIKKTAIDKCIDVPSILCMNTEQTNDLLTGLMADSHQPADHRSGKCFASISKDLVDAVVLLYRKMGIGCTYRLIVNHGGLGKNPIWRVYPRLYRKQIVKVVKIENAGVKHVYDIETEDHGIYLPDADIVVHNCDCKSLALAAYAYLQKIPFRFVAIRRPGRAVLHHVAVELFMQNQWIFFDPTYNFNSFANRREEAERVII